MNNLIIDEVLEYYTSGCMTVVKDSEAKRIAKKQKDKFKSPFGVISLCGKKAWHAFKKTFLKIIVNKHKKFVRRYIAI